MKTTKYPLNYKKIGYIALAWLLISSFQVCYDYLVVINFNADPSIYRFWPILIANGTIAIIAGSLAGVLLLKIESYIRNVPFWKAILGVSLFYALSGFILIGAGSLLFQMITQQQSPFAPEVQHEVQHFMVGADFLKHFLSWGVIMIGTIITLAVNDKYGQGNFKNFLLGRYFRPREEERIFMFLDLKGSTTIAEKLGAKNYFYFLKDFIADASAPILRTKGEIYQYVGDEIIVSWEMNNGLNNANCLECFYAIQEAILEKDKEYLEKYGCLPTFKAGLHYGQVMVGEMGMVKKEITFSGDVLNTASRIQMECNKHQVDLLLSSALVSILPLPTAMKPQALGDIELRGKQEKVGLSTISLNY